MKNDKNQKRVSVRVLAIVLFLLIFLFLIFQCQIKERNGRLEEIAKEQRELQLQIAIEKAQGIADSLIKEDSIKKADTVGEVSPSPAMRKSASSATPSAGGTPATPPVETVADSTPPQASILPPPGRYFRPIDLHVECGEPKCETEISIGDSLNPVKGKIENYNQTGKVYFRATDSARNVSQWQTATYDMARDNNCSENSYPVPVKGKTVCIDAYEFPNKYGEKPRNMVSQNAAVMLCENAGKRLCSVEEWQAACQGNQNSRYPYGNSYNQTKCATDLKSAKEPNRSGHTEHCRSYYGMYDMSGNLWEWTSTPAEREGLFLVAGGAWNTQNASSCTETKFSFYPQNEYPFVGFRCCK
ncbi:MAG: SUMF1/EgtB/PvdO family nonheme iron enzyme [Fibromonadaceae bacterium]|jgi:hypothetical protein|nr:SUMF1/EgtB/PvdO family nonheme iron enzyme [Fibromonadaceae bacterium]